MKFGCGVVAGVLGALLVSTLAAAGDGGELQPLRYNHPGLVVDLGVGLWAWPIPCDADGDGDFDLVVSGRRERASIARRILAGVSDRLARDCPKPLLVVHAPPAGGTTPAR